MQEEWRDVKGYENIYQVSNLGNVRSVDRYINQKNNKCDSYNHIYKGRPLKQYKNNAGYMQVQLSYLYKSIPKRVHRLVAEAFLENPNNYKCVNHIDGNKENNYVNNLEWCTYSHNNNEARRLGLNKGHKGMTYKKRCQFAIEYIRSNEWGKDYENSNCRTHLLNILQGEDNE